MGEPHCCDGLVDHRGRDTRQPVGVATVVLKERLENLEALRSLRMSTGRTTAKGPPIPAKKIGIADERGIHGHDVLLER
jgi:hypothetical protein